MTGRVSENFDDPAVCDLPVIAFSDHPGQFCPQSQQASDSALDGFELVAGNAADLLAGGLGHFLQSKHRLDGRDVETEIPGVSDERQPTNILRAVEASSAVGSGRRGYQLDPLIIADRLDIDARMFGQGSDSDHLPLASVVATGCTYSK